MRASNPPTSTSSTHLRTAFLEERNLTEGTIALINRTTYTTIPDGNTFANNSSPEALQRGLDGLAGKPHTTLQLCHATATLPEGTISGRHCMLYDDPSLGSLGATLVDA